MTNETDQLYQFFVLDTQTQHTVTKLFTSHQQRANGLVYELISGELKMPPSIAVDISEGVTTHYDDPAALEQHIIDTIQPLSLRVWCHRVAVPQSLLYSEL